jgi:hypothetical protein
MLLGPCGRKAKHFQLLSVHSYFNPGIKKIHMVGKCSHWADACQAICNIKEIVPCFSIHILVCF